MAGHVSCCNVVDAGTYICYTSSHIAAALSNLPLPHATCPLITMEIFHILATDMDNFASMMPADKQPHYWVCRDTSAHISTQTDFSDSKDMVSLLTCRPLTSFQQN